MPYAKSLSLIALLGLAVGAHAADFNADFNLSANPGTTGWTYGYTIALGDPLNAYSTLSTSGGNLNWYTPGLSGDQTPSVFKRSGSAGNNVALGEAGLHGGPGGQYSVARYTFTTAGTYNVAGVFGQGDIGNVDVFVRKGGSSLFAVENTPNTAAFNLTNVAFSAGESVDFVVGTAGNYAFDSTPLSATITPVPEPASMAILGLGALGLLRRRRA